MVGFQNKEPGLRVHARSNRRSRRCRDTAALQSPSISTNPIKFTQEGSSLIRVRFIRVMSVQVHAWIPPFPLLKS